MTIEKAIEMIDEYLLEPNNISREWVACLKLCRHLLKKELNYIDMRGAEGDKGV